MKGMEIIMEKEICMDDVRLLLGPAKNEHYWNFEFNETQYMNTCAVLREG